MFKLNIAGTSHVNTLTDCHDIIAEDPLKYRQTGGLHPNWQVDTLRREEPLVMTVGEQN